MPAFRSPCAARSIEKEFVGSRWLASQSLLTGCPPDRSKREPPHSPSSISRADLIIRSRISGSDLVWAATVFTCQQLNP